MAEGLAQKWLNDNGFSDWLAVSAGVFAIKGSPTSDETVKALSSRGIEFMGTSTPFTQKMATAAKIVICMSRSHLAAATRFTENAVLLNPEGDIPDPVGQDQSVYDALAAQMEKIIATKLKALTSEGA